MMDTSYIPAKNRVLDKSQNSNIISGMKVIKHSFTPSPNQAVGFLYLFICLFFCCQKIYSLVYLVAMRAMQLILLLGDSCKFRGVNGSANYYFLI
jgi:hypothetical protein